MEKKSLSQQTAERLYTMIVVERRFGPGDKLPNELEWSAELRVSRATLREAIRTLAARERAPLCRGRWRRLEISASPDWIRSRAGSGTSLN